MLHIQSSKGSYTVEALANLNDLLKCAANNANKSVAVLDEKVAEHYAIFHLELKKIMPVYLLKATEQNKDPGGLLNLLKFMQEQGLKRKSNLLVIGGGITQDLASLASQLYYRGIDYTLVPTTLLGMADSCIGSKSSLNFNGFKNQLGGFSPPSQIYICTDFLSTLTPQEIYSGLGEVLKIYIIGNRFKEINFDAILQNGLLDKDRIKHYIFQSLEIKKYFIEKDEFDLAERRILNYGHTFGHALELVLDYEVPHGLAVVLGIDIVNYLSVKAGILSEKTYNAMHQCISNFYPWHQFNLELSVEALIAAVKKDKKLEGDKINLILLSEEKGTIIFPVRIDGALQQSLSDYFNTCDIYQRPVEALNVG